MRPTGKFVVVFKPGHQMAAPIEQGDEFPTAIAAAICRHVFFPPLTEFWTLTANHEARYRQVTFLEWFINQTDYWLN